MQVLSPGGDGEVGANDRILSQVLSGEKVPLRADRHVDEVPATVKESLCEGMPSRALRLSHTEKVIDGSAPSNGSHCCVSWCPCALYFGCQHDVDDDDEDGVRRGSGGRAEEEPEEPAVEIMFFHGLLVLASVYFTMVLTSWGASA